MGRRMETSWSCKISVIFWAKIVLWTSKVRFFVSALKVWQVLFLKKWVWIFEVVKVNIWRRTYDLISKLMWMLLKRNIRSWKSTDQLVTVLLWKGHLVHSLVSSIFGKTDLLLGKYLSVMTPSIPPIFSLLISVEFVQLLGLSFRSFHQMSFHQNLTLKPSGRKHYISLAWNSVFHYSSVF